MKKKAKILTLIIAMAMVLTAMPVLTFAEGTYYVDTSYISLGDGETGYITITAEDASGKVSLVTTGGITVSKDVVWLDNGSEVITVTSTGGPGTITVVPTDISTIDVISGDEVEIDYTYTIQVDAASPAEAPAENTPEEPVTTTAAAQEAETTTAAAQEAETTTAAAQETETTTAAEETKVEKTVLTDGDNDYANKTPEERLYTTVNGQQHYIIRYPRLLSDNGDVVWNQEITGLDVLNGFELKTVNYKDVDLDVFQYQDILQVFVLKNLETDVCGYYVLGNKGFEKLNYVTANGKQYIVIDLASDFEVPAGYQLVELTLGNNTVKALKKTSRELKGYEVSVNPGLETVDPSEDIYYIYCLVDGVKQLYSYDSGEGTLQRAAAVVYKEVPIEAETVVVYEPAPVIEDNNQAAEDTSIGILDMVSARLGIEVLAKKTKLIALGVAAALVICIVILLILLICLAAANGKKRKLEKKLKALSRSSKPRKSGKAPAKAAPRKENDEEEGFFSYVKTETKENDDDDEFDLQDLK